MASLITTAAASSPIARVNLDSLQLKDCASIISDYFYCPDADISRFIQITRVVFGGLEDSIPSLDYPSINDLIGRLREISFIFTGNYETLNNKINCLAHARFLFTSASGKTKAFITIYQRVVAQRFTENQTCKNLLEKSKVIPLTDTPKEIYYELDGNRLDEIETLHRKETSVKQAGSNPLPLVLPPVTAIPQGLKVPFLMAEKFLPIPETNPTAS